MGPSANPMDNDSNIEEKSEAEFETDNEAQKQVHDTSMCARENSMHVQHDSPTRNTYGDAFDNEDGQIDMVDRVVLPNLSSNFVDWKIRVKELILLLLLTCLFRQLLLITPSWPYNLHPEQTQHNSRNASDFEVDLQNYPNDPLEGHEDNIRPLKPKRKVGRPRKWEKTSNSNYKINTTLGVESLPQRQ